jgi:hypothetical protein
MIDVSGKPARRLTPIRIRYIFIVRRLHLPLDIPLRRVSGIKNLQLTSQAVHIIVVVGYFLLSFLHDSFVWIPAVVSFLPIFIYIPAAVWISVRRSRRVFDRASAEIAYLSIQMALWLGARCFAGI